MNVKVYDIDAAQTVEQVMEPLTMPRYLVSKADYDALAAELAQEKIETEVAYKLISGWQREGQKRQDRIAELKAALHDVTRGAGDIPLAEIERLLDQP